MNPPTTAPVVSVQLMIVLLPPPKTTSAVGQVNVIPVVGNVDAANAVILSKFEPLGSI